MGRVAELGALGKEEPVAEIQIPPSPEVLAVCECICHVIEKYLEGLTRKRVRLGRFEAEVEAYILQKLVIRHSEAVVLMARHDLVTLPTAHVVARSCFETHVKIQWMLQPIDPFEREARWLQHLRSASEQFARLERDSTIHEDGRGAFSKQKKIVEGFANHVAGMLMAQKYDVASKIPSMWDMLKDLGDRHLYSRYVLLSAFVHSNYEAASLYRRNLGGGKELGEFIVARDWAFPLEVAWKSLYVCARSVLDLMESPKRSLDEGSLCESFRLAIEKLRNA